MHVTVDEGSVHVRLARWQKVLGLMRDITVPRQDVGDVCVVDDAVGEAMTAGIKVGLRLPWLYYVARTIGLDQAFVVRRGVPAVSFAVHGEGPLRRVLISTPEASELAARLGAPWDEAHRKPRPAGRITGSPARRADHL